MNNAVERYSDNFGPDYAKSLPSLGEAIAEILSFFNCQRIYGVGGDFAANIIKALEAHIAISPSSNEMHAGFTACGQAEIEGLGVCLTTYTVGSLPCTSAAALALTEKLPVVFISGAPGENEIGETALHHTVSSCATWHSEYNAALDAFKALGMRAERLQGERNPIQPNIAAEQFFKLVAHAYLNKEPVFIEIPRDLLRSKTQTLKLPASLHQLPQDLLISSGIEQVTAHVIEKLKKSQKPLVYLGVKAKLNKVLLASIRTFCEKFNIPYTTTWFAKGLLDEYSPLSLGAYNGVFSDPTHRHYIENEVDYVLEIATSIYPLDTNIAFNTGTHVLHHFKNKTAIKGTAQQEQDLVKIFELLNTADLTPFDFNYNSAEAEPIEPESKIDFHNITQVLNSCQDKDQRGYIYFPEIGNSYFASYGLKTRQSSLQRSWLCNPWYAAMGTSLPYARAACEQLKQQKSHDVAIVLTGDGGFNFQLNELIHFLRAELNVIIIYMRNDIFHLGKNSDAEVYQCSTPEFDVQTLIKAYGGEAKRCSTVAEFTDYFTHCAAQNSGIKLIEVPADTAEQYQCQQIQLLNLYIKAQNGDAEAEAKWQALKNN
jgi:TPP-dependent 2-oxoacid decarboxylase